MSRTFPQLLAWRWVTGVGSALQMSGSQLYLADISFSSNRARTMGTNQVRVRCCLMLQGNSQEFGARYRQTVPHSQHMQGHVRERVLMVRTKGS